jgi:hypothetical protein
MFIEREAIQQFFHALNDAEIPYVLLKNIGNEIPDQVPSGKDIDILVREDAAQQMSTFIRQLGFQKVPHPLGKERGWAFAYGLPPYQFWRQRTLMGNDLYIDICYRLSCRSLTPKIWIPLEAWITSSIWLHREWDAANGWWRMDEENLYVYLVVRCIFDKAGFSGAYITELEDRSALLDSPGVEKRFERIFFRFTAKLIHLLRNKQYAEIAQAYITFTGY